MNENRITFGIVEDEAIERTAMCLFIEQSFPEACVLWQAGDGRCALEAWRHEPADVLIIDIHMPVMDGLSLCEQLSALNCDSVIVINTAYDSFAYAKRALSLHAFDYIVKPVENAELERILRSSIEEVRRRRAIARRKREHQQLRRSMGHLAIEQMVNNPRAAVESRQYLEPIGWPEDRSYQTRVIHFFSSAALDAERMQALEGMLSIFSDADWLVASDFVAPRHMIALIDVRRSMNPQKLYTLMWMYGKYHARHSNLYIRISAPCSDKESVALECAWTPVGLTSGQLDMPPRSWKLLRTAESDRLTNTIRRFLCDGQISRALRQLNELRQSTPDPDLEWELIQWSFLAMLNVWPEQNLLDAVLDMYRSKGSASADALLRYCEKLPALDAGDVIDRALQIMREEFGGDLSQSSLANRLGLEQGYFSRLFKKRCGRNFSEVLTEIRMQHAEQMLISNPTATLDELCRACGLTSKTYFSEAFKKWKGMTITQFLKSLSK